MQRAFITAPLTDVKRCYNVLGKIHLKELKEGEIPNHVAIIPDGNRRYAEKVGVDFYTAYKKGAERQEK